MSESRDSVVKEMMCSQDQTIMHTQIWRRGIDFDNRAYYPEMVCCHLRPLVDGLHFEFIVLEEESVGMCRLSKHYQSVSWLNPGPFQGCLDGYTFNLYFEEKYFYFFMSISAYNLDVTYSIVYGRLHAFLHRQTWGGKVSDQFFSYLKKNVNGDFQKYISESVIPTEEESNQWREKIAQWNEVEQSFRKSAEEARREAEEARREAEEARREAEEARKEAGSTHHIVSVEPKDERSTLTKIKENGVFMARFVATEVASEVIRRGPSFISRFFS